MSTAADAFFCAKSKKKHEAASPAQRRPGQAGRGGEDASRVARNRVPSAPELKGSIGEGSNHSNFSDRSSTKNSVKIQEFSLEKNQEISTFSKISAKFRQNFIQIGAKFNEKYSKITNFCKKMLKNAEKFDENFLKY